jgi:hypothetical protein
MNHQGLRNSGIKYFLNYKNPKIRQFIDRRISEFVNPNRLIAERIGLKSQTEELPQRVSSHKKYGHISKIVFRQTSGQ